MTVDIIEFAKIISAACDYGYHQGMRNDLREGNRHTNTAECIGKAFNISARTVSRLKALSQLHEGLQECVRLGHVKVGAVDCLAGLSMKDQETVADFVMRTKLPVTRNSAMCIKRYARADDLSQSNLRYLCTLCR